MRIVQLAVVGLAAALAALAALAWDGAPPPRDVSPGSGTPAPSATPADAGAVEASALRPAVAGRERPSGPAGPLVAGAPAPAGAVAAPEEELGAALASHVAPGVEGALDPELLLEALSVGFAPEEVPGAGSAEELLLEHLAELPEDADWEGWERLTAEAARIAQVPAVRELYVAQCLLYREEAGLHEHGLHEVCSCEASALPEVARLRSLRARAVERWRRAVLDELDPWFAPYGGGESKE